MSMFSTTVDAVIFDMYDTLCKRDPDPLRELIDECAVPPFELPRIRRTLMTQHFPDVASIARFLQAPASVDVARYERAVTRTINDTILYPDVRDTLTLLKEGGMRIGLVSNLSTAYRAPFFAHRLEKYIAAPVFSCDVGMVKPERGIYLLACEKLGVAPARALMVGDSSYADVRGALAAGLQAIHLRRKGQPKHTSEITELAQLIDYF